MINSKRIMNDFLSETNGFKTIYVYYTYTDSFFAKKPRDVLDKTKLLGNNFCPGKND